MKIYILFLNNKDLTNLTIWIYLDYTFLLFLYMFGILIYANEKKNNKQHDIPLFYKTNKHHHVCK